tara:strand:- start:1426 stop:1770 length:345 start_codon:yes stop_codon:yes gene_type:complete
MGYRSEIVLVVGKEALPLFLTALSKQADARSLCYSHADKRVDDYEDGAVLFHWDHIKWYDSFKEVAAIEQFMDDCDSNDLEDHYRFVRSGEELDDNEVRGWGFDHVYITRSVEY